MKTNLEIIGDTDVFPYADINPDQVQQLHNGLYALTWEDEHGAYPLGYMLDRVVKELLKVPVQIRGEMEYDDEARTVTLFKQATQQERSVRAAALADYWREREAFSLLKGWRGELWPVYGRKGELLFNMERAAMGLLGTMRYGVHLIAYVKDDTAPHGIKLWVPTRAADKSTYPSMLDNTVAGGLMSEEDPFECIIREADEEASLPEDLMRSRAKCVGTITYIDITKAEYVGEEGLIYPECQWVYDLELPANVTPKPKDGEVECFQLCNMDQVKRDLAEGKFKPNCALVTIDFFIRHGILTAEDEPELEQIKRRVRREIPLPGPHQDSWRRASGKTE